MNSKLFQAIFNKNPNDYTDAQKLKMISTVQKAIQSAPTRPNDSILFLKGDDVQKVMDLSKLFKLYTDCFGSNIKINPSHIYAFYITGTSVSSIVSTLTIEIDETTATLWNVCNDLQIKGGYMRSLMDASLDYIRKKYIRKKYIRKKCGVKTVQLYVLLSNPYYEKAVALYRSRGFKVDTQFISEYGDRIRMIYTFL
jgi:hypothetical protein